MCCTAPASFTPEVVASDLNLPRALAIGSDGTLYVADSGSAQAPGSGRVLKLVEDRLVPVLTGIFNWERDERSGSSSPGARRRAGDSSEDGHGSGWIEANELVLSHRRFAYKCACAKYDVDRVSVGRDAGYARLGLTFDEGSVLPTLPQQAIHGDAHFENVIAGGVWEIPSST